MPNVIHIDEVDNKSGQEINIHVMEAERGPQGEQGEPGQAATIEAGNAYSVDTDARPAVMNVGTDTNAKFDFYIPKGEKGEQGEPGVVQYKAGRGIYISKDNTISATGGGGGGGGAWGEIIGDIQDQTDLQAEFANYTPTANLAAVATSGSYNDLSNKPSIPAAQVQSDWSQSNPSAVDYIKNKPYIPPDIPTVNDATLTIQQNGTNVATFTANSATNTTANITSPVITMTTTDPGEGGILPTNNFIGVYGGEPIVLDYTDAETAGEVNTGTKWVDQNTIYKKTFHIYSQSQATSLLFDHDIDNLGIIIKLEGVLFNHTGSKSFIPLPCLYEDPTDNVRVWVSETKVTIATGNSYSLQNKDIYLTLYYTKAS